MDSGKPQKDDESDTGENDLPSDSGLETVNQRIP
jgi:hypothetical protein